MFRIKFASVFGTVCRIRRALKNAHSESKNSRFRRKIAGLITRRFCAECLLPPSGGNKPRLFVFGLLGMAQI